MRFEEARLQRVALKNKSPDANRGLLERNFNFGYSVILHKRAVRLTPSRKFREIHAVMKGSL